MEKISLQHRMKQPLQDVFRQESLNLSDVQKKVIAAALALFADKGYEGTTTQAIAKLAEVSEKTLFKHFRSKEILFAETMYPALLQFIRPFAFDELKKLIASMEPNLQENLTAIARERLQFALERTDVLKFIVQELLLRPEFRESFIELWKSQLLPHSMDLLEQMKHKGELRSDLSPQSILRVFMSCIAGYALTRTVLAPGEAWDDDLELKTTVEILMNGVRPRD